MKTHEQEIRDGLKEIAFLIFVSITLVYVSFVLLGSVGDLRQAKAALESQQLYLRQIENQLAEPVTEDKRSQLQRAVKGFQKEIEDFLNSRSKPHEVR